MSYSGNCNGIIINRHRAACKIICFNLNCFINMNMDNVYQFLDQKLFILGTFKRSFLTCKEKFTK